MKYRVIIPELRYNHYLVEAETEEEALDIAYDTTAGMVVGESKENVSYTAHVYADTFDKAECSVEEEI